MPIHDFTDAINELMTGTYTGHRKVAGAPVKGRAAEASDTEFTFDASITPISGRALQRLSEGMRTLEPVSIITTYALRASKGDQLPDVVEYLDDTYEVQTVKNWLESGNFYEVVATKIGR